MQIKSEDTKSYTSTKKRQKIKWSELPEPEWKPVNWKQMRDDLGSLPYINDTNVLESYCRKNFASDRETIIVFYMNNQLKLLHVELNSIGLISQCTSNARNMFKNALDVGANTILIVHNHPSGSALFSRSDKKLLKSLVLGGIQLEINISEFAIFDGNRIICTGKDLLEVIKQEANEVYEKYTEVP